MVRLKPILSLVIPLFCVAHGASLSNVVEVACKRNPKLNMCAATRPGDESPLIGTGSSTENKTVVHSQAASQSSQNLNRSQMLHLRALAAQIAKVPGNPFVEQVRKDQDLVEFADEDEDDKGFINNQHKGGGSFVRSIDNTDAGSRIDEYCVKYQENYRYYCQGEPDRPPRLREVLYKFCPSYEINCPEKASQTSEELSAPIGKPTNPFSASSQRRPQQQQTDGFPDPSAPPKKFAIPCTPDCDIREHRHCTAECKCDFLYPIVQKFCNPPPIPLFLSTCRLWYNGCPKYERYHYASQFIYSKAEKGKKIAGPLPANGAPPPVGPVGGAGAGGFGGLGGPLRALARAAGTSKKEIYEPRARASGSQTQADGNFLSAWSIDNRPAQDEHGKISNSAARSGRARASGASSRSKLEEGFVPQRGRVDSPIRPKAFQGNFPVLDPRSGGSNGYHQFDGLTDSQGVFHRPRSRSPFTKPGLWEPNPDNPHNRDHANKWYYHPDSVTADWLNGQVNWGRHWAVPAAGVGGTDGYSTLHFPTIGTFLNIADDYD
ncbi:hypothetical protein QR680_003472 [Steinernema hermaphroditum]|uniref:ShKT domain-containing protein n=1 Tax=Steinernema hermaphroditum TaxID=289476 RepID=A0AA39H6Z0_9BILA|nr:hypothetical protein QR680_003472 [Steinernema hermaphroditum]